MISVSPALGNDSARAISRIFVAYDHRRRSEQTLIDAVALARKADAEVIVLFVQDESLMRLASLPFAHEINRTSGLVSRLDTAVLARQMARQVAHLHRLVAQSARLHQVTASVRVVRGNLAEQALAAAGERDVVFIDVRDQSVRFYSLFGPGRGGGRISSTVRVPSDIHFRKVIAVIYDGSTTADRALHIAGHLGGAMHADLVIALPVQPASDADSSALRDRAALLLGHHALGHNGAPVRYESFSTTDPLSLPQLARRNGCAMVIVSADNPLLAGSTANRLFESIDCPVALVR